MKILKSIAKLAFKLTGWGIEGDKPHNYKKVLYLGGPHTSNWDYVVSLCAMFILDIKAKCIVKSELMFFPLNIILNKFGVIPIDRSKIKIKDKSNIDIIVEEINKHEDISIAMSPKGTRKKVNKLKTGFFHIARQANIPVCLCAFDFGKKKIIFSEPYFLGDNLDEEITKVLKFYQDKTPKHPEKNFEYPPDFK